MSNKKEHACAKLVKQCEDIRGECEQYLINVTVMSARAETEVKGMEAYAEEYADNAVSRAAEHLREYTNESVKRMWKRTREARNRDQKRIWAAMVTGFSAVGLLSVIALGTALGAVKADNSTASDNRHIVFVTPMSATTSAEETGWQYCPDIPLDADDQEALYNAAAEFDIPYPLALAVVERESSFRNVAGDSGRSIGYLQVNGTYHTELMEEIGASDLWTPEDNFRTGLAILSQEIQRGSTIHEALMAYNMGRTGAYRLLCEGITSSRYSRDVVSGAEHWSDVLG